MFHIWVNIKYQILRDYIHDRNTLDKDNFNILYAKASHVKDVKTFSFVNWAVEALLKFILVYIV